MTKQETLKKIQDEWERLISTLAAFSDGQKLQPHFVGKWSIKDLIGHISAWESVALERLGRMQRGEKVELIPYDQIDEWNNQLYEQRRNWKLIVVEGEFEHVHSRLVQQFERLSDEAWDRNEARVCEWIPECTFVHYAEHRTQLESIATSQQGVTR
jgi:hypothetical protein